MLKSFLMSASALTLLAVAGPMWAQETATDEAPAEDVIAEDAPSYDATDASTVLARVNGIEITLGHVIALRQSLPENYQALPDEQLLDGILNQMIEQILLNDDVNAPLPYDLQLQMENETRAQLAARRIDEILSREVSDEELQALYDADVAGIEPQVEYNASHILVETEEEANAIIESLAADGDFAAIAAEKSLDGGSGAAGGSLGWFGLGRMVPEFEAAVVALEVGAVSAPVQSQFGWHVIRLDDKRDQPLPTVEELRAELSQEILRREVVAVIDGLRDAATIETGMVNVDPAQTRAYDLISE